MLPKRGDIVKTDVPCEAQPVFSGRAGGLYATGKKELFVEGTLLKYLRTKNDMAMVQVVLPPKVRKMVKNINPDTNSRQSFVVDAYSVSFHCKKEDLVW